MKEITIFLLLLLNVFSINGQHQKQSETDSLKKILPSLKDKSLVAQTYNRIGNSYIHNNSDSSVYYLLQSLQLANEIKDFDIAGKSYIELSYVYREKGQYDSALFYSKGGLDIIEKQNDPLSKAKLNYNIALIFKMKGQYDTAHTLLKQNLQILQKIESDRGLAVTNNALGQLSEHNSDYALALEYYYDALTIYQKLGDKSGEAIVHNNIGIVYERIEQNKEALKHYNLYYQYNKEVGDKYRMAIGLKNAGNILEKIGKLDSAILNYKIALETDSLLGSHESMSYDLVGLGSAHLAKKDYASAFQYFHRAFDISKDPIVTVPAIIGIGTIHLQYNSLDSALFYLETALERCNTVGLSNEKKDVHYLLYELYNKLGDTEKSFDYFREYVGIKDSIFNSKSIQEVAYLKAGFEFEEERKRQEILKKAEIDQANYIRNIFIVGMLFSAIIAFLLYIIYRRNKIAKEKLNGLYETVKRQAVELKDLDQTKSNFYANISHELRTPLTLISSPTEYLLSKDYHNDPELISHLELINRNTKHLKVLVDDMLDLSKLESHKVSIVREPVNISAFIKRVFANFESLASHLDMKYQLVFDSVSQDIILIDSLKLEKILNNLLSNAFKYTLSGGEIKLTVSKDENTITFEVRDNGEGIETEDLPFIFDRYFQSKQPKATLQGGSGIGLALSKGLANEIGGKLNVTSEKGVGSVFSLSIPNESVNMSDIPDDFENTIPVRPESSYLATDEIPCLIEEASTILLVEDHQEMQAFVKGLLNPLGNILVANNGKEALDILSKESVDLIISDVMMPEMDGHELLEAVREKESIANIPFIMLTALKSEHNLLKALSIGVDDYLIKPFSPQELIARVNNMLARHVLRKTFASETLEVEEDDLHAYLPQVKPKDRQLVEEMENILLSKLEDENFSLKELGDIFCLSYRQLERNIKSITGLTPKQFQQEVALQQARKLLEEKEYGNPTAIAYSIGIRHVTRFSMLYEKRFGKKPIDYFN